MKYSQNIIVKVYIIGWLVGIYMMPYKFCGLYLPVLTVIGVLLRAPKIKIENSLVNKQLLNLAYAYMALAIYIVINGYINSIGAGDVFYSILFFCMPLTIFSIFIMYSSRTWYLLIKWNVYFIYLQIPFFIVQLFSRDLAITEDWFRGSMLEQHNTQIVSFVFFCNFWLYIEMYMQERCSKYLRASLLALVFALATNTLLQSGAFSVSVIVAIMYRINLKKILFSVFIIPLLLLIIVIFIKYTSNSYNLILNYITGGWETLGKVGKISGLEFALETWLSSLNNFFFGTGLGGSASRLMLYKLPTADSNLPYLSPLKNIFYEFTKGLYLPSNIHRPWSDITAFFLEGGVIMIGICAIILNQLWEFMKKSSRLTAMFVFFLLMLFIDHPLDNIKMASFLYMIIIAFSVNVSNTRTMHTSVKNSHDYSLPQTN